MGSTRIGDGRLEMLGELLRVATPTASLPQQAGRTRLVASVEQMGQMGTRGARRRPSRAKRAGVALVFVAATAAALVVLRVRGPQAARAPLGWHVENGAAGGRGYVSVPLTAPSARLVFDDGSDVALAPGSRGRVPETTSVGATMVLEDGQARVHVAYGEHARWLVDAGPFAARVNGTDLVVAWSADVETLEVWVTSGHVEVTGPMLGDGLRLSGGQHLRVRPRDGTLRIDVAPDPARAPCVSKASFLSSVAPSRDLGSEPCAVR